MWYVLGEGKMSLVAVAVALPATKFGRDFEEAAFYYGKLVWKCDSILFSINLMSFDAFPVIA